MATVLVVRKEREKGSLTKEKQMRDPRARAKVIDSAMFVDVLVTWQRAVGRTRSR